MRTTSTDTPCDPSRMCLRCVYWRGHEADVIGEHAAECVAWSERTHADETCVFFSDAAQRHPTRKAA